VNDYKLGLAGLRGLAACLVMLSHMALYNMLPSFPILGFGVIGVMLFFVLSGFLMGSLYLSKPANFSSVSGFVNKRFARVYPLYFVVLVLFGTAYGLSGFEIFTHLVFLDGQYVFWTVLVEVKFYGLFIILWLALQGRSERTQFITLLALYLACMFLPQMDKGSLLQNLQIFVLGMMIAVSGHRIDDRFGYYLPIGLLSLVGISSYALILHIDNTNSVYRIVPVQILMALLVLAATKPINWLTKPIAWNWVLKLGDWSFGIYLLHIPILKLFLALAISWELYLWTMVIPATILIVYLSKTSYDLLERPARKYLVRV